jgi:hypothetical protein
MAWLHAVIDVPTEQVGSAADFWGAVSGWPAGPPWASHPELRSFEPPHGTPYIHLQEITGSPRVHVDVESKHPDAAVRRALELGAGLVGEHDRWRTLRSPGGLPFCVLAGGAHEPPEPVRWPDGHRTRMVQVCVDAPRAAHDREVDFWHAFLPGRWAGSQAREFAGKWHDDAGSPVQLLFQRLDEPDGPVRAHLDLGTDDVEIEIRRILDLGAADIGPGRGWWTLRDPTGLPFCVTGNSPLQTPFRDIG